MVQDEQRFWKGWQGSRVFLSRVLWCALLWYVLTGGAAASWVVGVPAVLGAALLSAWMLPPLRWSPGGAARYLVFFLWESLLGGIDVARRAMLWRMPLDPGIVEHRSRVSRPLARVAAVNTASLLPGTLVMDLDERHSYVHALDAGGEVRESLERSEERIADLFGLELESREQDRTVG